MAHRTDKIVEILLRINAHLPLSVLHGMGYIIGSLLAIIPSKRLNTCQANIKACFPELSDSEQKRLLRRNFRQTAKGLLEVGKIWLLPIEKNLSLIKSVSGEEFVRQSLENGKGVILASPHLGSWEIAGSYVSSKFSLTAMYKNPLLKGLEKLIKEGRDDSGSQYFKTDTRGVRALLKALRNGKAIGLLPDQVPSQGGTIAPFFGNPALTMNLLSNLASKTGATVIFAFAVRLPWARGFHMHYLPPDKLISSSPLEESVARINAQIEKCIRLAPDQYLWVYKRFQKNGQHFYDR